MLSQEHVYVYDINHQLVSVKTVAGAPVADYRYDAFGRRLTKVLGGDPATTVEFSHGLSGGVIEERDITGTTTASYAYGHRGEILQMVRGGADYYFHQDPFGNVMVVTDSNGGPVEHYDYGPDGQAVNIGQGVTGNPFLFRGYYHDAETGLCIAGGRYLSTRAGRFIYPAPGGVWGMGSVRGNATTFAAANPWSGFGAGFMAAPGPVSSGGGEPLGWSDCGKPVNPFGDTGVIDSSGEAGEPPTYIVIESHPAVHVAVGLGLGAASLLLGAEMWRRMFISDCEDMVERAEDICRDDAELMGDVSERKSCCSGYADMYKQLCEGIGTLASMGVTGPLEDLTQNLPKLLNEECLQLATTGAGGEGGGADGGVITEPEGGW